MPAHLVFFLGALSFLSGIVYASIGLTFVLTFVPAAIVCAVLYVSGVDTRIALLSALLLIMGKDRRS